MNYLSIKISAAVLSLLALGWGSHQRLSKAFGWPDITTPMERWTEHHRRVTHYCGRFGKYIYRFPVKYVSPFFQYEGETVWGGRTDWTIKGCADNFLGIFFSFEYPEIRMLPQSTSATGVHYLGVSVSMRGNSPHYIKERLSEYPQFLSAVRSNNNYAADVGLRFFDVEGKFPERIFWRVGEPGVPDLYISCSVGSKVPFCSLYVTSDTLDAGVDLGMAMTNLPHWERVLKGVEQEVAFYKVPM